MDKYGKNKKKKAGNQQKHSKEDKLTFKDDDLRWATNELVADWRAERLKCERLADLGCGIGLQAMSFAKKCRHVHGVDISPEKIASAQKNAQKLNFKNIDYKTGDALSDEIISSLEKCEVVFLDPERQESEEKRTIESIKPNLKEFLKKYEIITDKIAIELPPQIREVPFDCELEYASINGKLNRLTAYFGHLKKTDRSAVVLPKRAILESDKKAKLESTSIPQKYLFEVDPAIHKARLLPELCDNTGAELLFEGKQAFFTSDKQIESDFFKSRYKILEAIEFEQDEIIAALKKHDAGKVIIRYNIPPEQYWTDRNLYERSISGTKQVALFQFNDLAIIGEEILKK